MALAGRHFAHRSDVIANGWFDVGPTCLAQANVMPTVLFQVLRLVNVDPT